VTILAHLDHVVRIGDHLAGDFHGQSASIAHFAHVMLGPFPVSRGLRHDDFLSG
jgi:hypothetical protein